MEKNLLRRLCALPWVLILMLFLSLPVVGHAASTGTIPVTIQGVQDYEKAYEVLEYTNKVRAEAGQEPLVMDQELLAVAMQRAAEIVLYTEHTRPDKTSCFTISSRLMGENIAAGQSTVSEVVSDWTNSSGHYQNMIKSTYQSIGIGVFRVGTTYYWVQSFGTAEAVSVSQPSNSTVKVQINVDIDLAYECIYVDLPDDNTLTVGKSHSMTLSWYYQVSDTSSKFVSRASLFYSDFLLKSDQTEVLYPNSTGVVQALSPGTARLTLRSRTNSSFIEETTITVKATSNTRKIILKTNGGYIENGSSSVKSLSVYVTNGKKYGTLPTPKRKGYTFSGWYTKKSGGKKVTSSSKVSVASGKTQTLYAHWKKVSVARTSISKIKAKTNGLAAISWKKISGASGYQILYSTTKKFTKSTRTSLSVTGTKTTANISGLVTGTRYYIAVRAWKYDSCGKKVYGRYSVVKNFVSK